MRGFHKKRALTLAVAVAVGVLAAACSNGSTTSSPSSKTFGDNATGTVHFWARQATDGPAKALVAAFNASHKNLKVVLHLTPPNDDTSQLATAIRAGSVPDVVGLNDIDVPTFSHEHALMDITKYVNALPYKASLSPGHLKLATINGHYYGLPYLADLSVLWYNKKLFKEAGLNPNARRPTTRRSWPTPRRSARSGTASMASPSPATARAVSASRCCPHCGRWAHT